MDQREAEMEDAGACDAEPRLRREVEREKRRRWAAGEEEKDWAVEKDSGRASLGWFLCSFSFSFSISTQTNSNLIEFKFKFEFKTPMHSNKIKPCTSMNATTSLNLEKF